VSRSVEEIDALAKLPDADQRELAEGALSMWDDDQAQRRNHRPHEGAGLPARRGSGQRPTRCRPPTGSAAFRAGAAKANNEGEQFYVRYCFADLTYADAFFDRFGDERLTGKPSRRSRSGSVALIQCCRTKPRGRGAPSDALANSARCAHFCSERL
jgi:hypothetical protein